MSDFAGSFAEERNGGMLLILIAAQFEGWVLQRSQVLIGGGEIENSMTTKREWWDSQLLVFDA